MDRGTGECVPSETATESLGARPHTAKNKEWKKAIGKSKFNIQTL